MKILGPLSSRGDVSARHTRRCIASALAALAAAGLTAAMACGGPVVDVVVLGDAGAGPSQTDASTSDVSTDAPDAAPSNGCPSGRGPTMAALPGAEGGVTCIDTTEVTMAQYAVFLADTGGAPSGQPDRCAWNDSLVPATTSPNGRCGYDPVGHASYPVGCVDWCDAYAFCQWAGESLCDVYGPHGGGWAWACNSGPDDYQYVYGNTFEAGRCIDTTYDAARPVGSAAGCQSPVPTFGGVFDLLGNVAEWAADGCTLQDSGVEDVCAVVGGGADDGLSAGFQASCPAYDDEWALSIPRNSVDPDLGFRCCANQ